MEVLAVGPGATSPSSPVSPSSSSTSVGRVAEDKVVAGDDIPVAQDVLHHVVWRVGVGTFVLD